MWRIEGFRSSAFRATAIVALATMAATLAIFAFVYWQITSAEEANARRILSEEADRAVNYTDAELKNALELRLTRDLRRLDYAAFFDPSGKPILGNIKAMPPIRIDGEPHIDRTARPPGRPDQLEPAIFVARPRADGSVLLLGRSLVELEELRETVLRTLALSCAPALIVAFAIGGWAARRMSRRLRRIKAILTRIMQGDLSARLPDQKSTDDIGRISRDVNVMLDELVRVIGQIRSVGDNIAHDLRTPISVIRARLERSVNDPDALALRASVRRALTDLDSTMVTIAALLRLAEVENAPRSRVFEKVDMAPICVDLFEFYEPLAREKSILMTIEATPPVLVNGDADLLREALANVIDNAIKYTEPGGSIRIKASMDGARAFVRICDTGPGVAQVDKQAIFDRFHRVGAADNANGVGLGLNIAAAIAKLHEFDFRVGDNHPGSVFELSPRV